MTQKIFKGTGVALATPFRSDGSVDFTSLKKLVQHVSDNGANYLVVLGTTGETPVLSGDEKNAIVDHVKEINSSKLPVVLGLGGNSTSLVLKTIMDTDFTGIDAILSVAPYYNKPNQEGLYQHFKSIAGASPVPVILYNVPGRTGSNISAETVLRLASEFKNQVIAVKEASGNLQQVSTILKNKPEKFLVISGDDSLTLPMIALGASGVISVIANAFTKEFSSLVNLCLESKFQEARKIQYQLLPVYDMLFEEGSPAGLKAFLEVMCIVENNLRLPLVPVSKGLHEKIRKFVTK